MQPARHRFLALGLALLAPPAAAAGDIEFRKVHIDTAFRSEGVATADVNGDGKKDILAGALWYEAPRWTPHQITVVKEFFPLKGYSDSFSCFSDDLSGDGRADLIVIGFPGAPVRVYENPGPEGLDRHWKEYQAFASCCNESPAYTDIDGDGRRDIVCGFEPGERMAWFTPGKTASEPWKRHSFSGPKMPGASKFYHGLGVGDINKDGRKDVVTPEGWYEAPAARGPGNWTFHKEALGPGARNSHIYVHDFDGDGNRDVLMACAHGKGIWWYEQKPGKEGGRVWIEHTIDASYTQTHAVVLVDLNRDGLPDFVTGKRWKAHQGHDPEGGDEYPPYLCWYELHREGGKPVWTKHVIDDDSGVGTQFEVSDVNGDGRLDIVISNKKGVFYFEQTP